ncbi:glyoxalase [Mucilaginibacter flavus]|uniref:glyoxalase n=1 Tax=Mucilaginibacter flavus TaxID=931504 RepID=UPI0025B4D081|nr:glyoxalase [Mucilaginibacter flavus]MDN3582232.1 glyoxalase [Mucilaginibacter flavus]
MENSAISIRPFIGARDFKLSKSFYRDLGFNEVILTPTMSLFKTNQLGFYLQDAFVKDWIDNTMVFLEVEDVVQHWNTLISLKLSDKYTDVKLSPVRVEHWGRECFLHDPSGILWHFGEFFQSKSS